MEVDRKAETKRTEEGKGLRESFAVSGQLRVEHSTTNNIFCEDCRCRDNTPLPQRRFQIPVLK